jgi:hypothetical protein
MGELLSGDRTYFPLPVAYDNARRPMIPRELGAGLGELARAMREGLGECPPEYPYESAGGSCSNIAPGVDAHTYFRSGGVLSEEGTVGPLGDDTPTLECAYGTRLNPATGRTECRSEAEALYTTGSGYVQRTSTSLSTMQKIAADATAGAIARGLPISCKAVAIGGDLLNNNQQVYAAECSSPAGVLDGAALLTGMGYETAAVEIAAATGKPLAVVPQFGRSANYNFIPPTSQQGGLITPSSPSAASGSASAPVVRTAQTSSSVQRSTTTAGTPGAGAESLIAGVSDIAARAQESLTDAAAGLGVPSWALLAGAGAAAYFVLKGGKR